LEGFTLPGDTAPSARYWAEDIITPEVTMHHGQIEVPTGPGLGYEVKTSMLESLTTQEFTVELR
jgi:o-succinylbenzoate synthase